MSKNQSLLSLMPPEAQKQVLLLIKRLGDEKQAKQSAQKQCLQYEAEIIELKKELEKLKKENITLKAKWQSSFSMISNLRENFSDSKRNGEDNEETGKRRLRFDKENGNWMQGSEEEEDEKPRQIDQKGENSRTQNNNSFKQHNFKNKYFAIGSPSHQVPITNIQTSRLQQNSLPSQQVPPQTGKKPPRNPLSSLQSHQKPPNPSSLNKSRQLNTTRSNKKLQIECLKQEIEQLSGEIKTKEAGSMSLSDKIRKCEEIKNRYKKGGEDSRGQMNSSELMMVNSYQSPRKDQTQLVDQYNNQQSFINELQSNQKPCSFVQRSPNSTPVPQQSQFHLKQNIRMNSHIAQVDQSFSSSNNSFVQGNNGSVHEANGYNGFSNHSIVGHQMASSNVMRKTTIKSAQQQQPSFYDDGLLDLIADLNP